MASLLTWLMRVAASWLLSPVSLSLLLISIVSSFWFVRRRFGYWRRRGVTGPRPAFPWGTEAGNFFVTEGYKLEEWMYTIEPEKPFFGFLEMLRPVLYVRDFDLMRSIMIKDFEHFTDRRDLTLSQDFVQMVSQMSGEEWKTTRAVMTPTFSASKLRGMHTLCLENATNLENYIREHGGSNKALDMLHVFGCFTMDNIASCAFGVRCNSFNDPDTTFTRHARRLFTGPKGWEVFRALCLLVFPAWIVYKLLPDPYTKTSRFFRRVIQDVMAQRAKEDVPPRHDFLHLLMETKDADGRRLLSDESVVSQSMIFFIAGYDTTANLLSFAAFLLALNPDVQHRARQEVTEVLARHDGQLTYEAVSDLTYLSQLIDETLRLFPPLLHHERRCTKRYNLPGTDIVIEPDSLVTLPVLPIHRDASIYPEPFQFKPERFAPEVLAARHPSAFMPFGAGPRQCLARRFALYEAKVALTLVLRHFWIRPAADTPVDVASLKFDGKSLLLTPEGRRMPLIIEKKQVE